MKAITAKLLVSLVGFLLIAPFFAVALIIGARAMALSHGAQDDLLMVALALGGAVASVVNGMGRRTLKEKRAAGRAGGAKSRTVSRRASMIRLGF